MSCMSSGTRRMVLLALFGATAGPALAQQSPEQIVVAAAPPQPTSDSASQPTRQLSPEEKMQRRYPQPARAGDLIGLPVLDDYDRTIGRIAYVVRTPSGKLQFIVPYGGFLGWGGKLVAVPIEVVAIAGRQLAALDMTRAEFDAAPAWNAVQTTPVAHDDIIRIGLYRR